MAAHEQADPALLADLAALRLEQGDAQGAEALFRQALQARQQAGDDGGCAAAEEEAGAAAEGDGWEAWDEASVPAPPPAGGSSGGAADWEGAAEEPPRRSRRAAASGGGGGSRPAEAAAPGGGGEGAGGGEALPYGGGHVLELWELTPAVRTQDLEAMLERHCRGHQAPPTLKGSLTYCGPNCPLRCKHPCLRARWVDDCHAAVVCCSPAAARQLLAAATAPSAASPYRLRSYADAGSGTRRLPPSELLPPKPRPKTNASVAARLIGGALNMRLRDKDAEQRLAAERRQQRQAAAEREAALEAAWDD